MTEEKEKERIVVPETFEDAVEPLEEPKHHTSGSPKAPRMPFP